MFKNNKKYNYLLFFCMKTDGYANTLNFLVIRTFLEQFPDLFLREPLGHRFLLTRFLTQEPDFLFLREPLGQRISIL